MDFTFSILSAYCSPSKNGGRQQVVNAVKSRQKPPKGAVKARPVNNVSNRPPQLTETCPLDEGHGFALRFSQPTL